jgi:hypothetical protein
MSNKCNYCIGGRTLNPSWIVAIINEVITTYLHFCPHDALKITKEQSC